MREESRLDNSWRFCLLTTELTFSSTILIEIIGADLTEKGLYRYGFLYCRRKGFVHGEEVIKVHGKLGGGRVEESVDFCI